MSLELIVVLNIFSCT